MLLQSYLSTRWVTIVLKLNSSQYSRNPQCRGYLQKNIEFTIPQINQTMAESIWHQLSYLPYTISGPFY